MILTMSTYPYNQYLEPTSPHQHSAVPWEIDCNNQQDLFSQDHQQQQYSPHPVIQLEEHQPVVPHEQQQLFSAQQRASEGRSDEDFNSQCLRDASSRHHSTSPYAGSSSMPVRRPPTRPQTRLASHPYRRPQSAAPGASSRPSTISSAATATSSAKPQHHHQVRFAPDTKLASRPPPPVVIPTQNAAAGLSSASSSSSPSHILRNTPPAAAAAAATTARQDAGAERWSSYEKPEARRFVIRSDVYFDAERKVLSALLELPGVKKTDLHVRLSTCVYNRVRQLTISGKSSSVFPIDSAGFAVRERKYGEFARTLAVPPDTIAEDIHAEMEDGILLLRIACHQVAEPEEPQEILIR